MSPSNFLKTDRRGRIRSLEVIEIENSKGIISGQITITELRSDFFVLFCVGMVFLSGSQDRDFSFWARPKNLENFSRSRKSRIQFFQDFYACDMHEILYPRDRLF